MRFIHDHPRDWRTLAPYLSVEDADKFRAFAFRSGVLLELAPPEVVEELYEEWVLTGAA